MYMYMYIWVPSASTLFFLNKWMWTQVHAHACLVFNLWQVKWLYIFDRKGSKNRCQSPTFPENGFQFLYFLPIGAIEDQPTEDPIDTLIVALFKPKCDMTTWPPWTTAHTIFLSHGADILSFSISSGFAETAGCRGEWREHAHSCNPDNQHQSKFNPILLVWKFNLKQINQCFNIERLQTNRSILNSQIIRLYLLVCAGLVWASAFGSAWFVAWFTDYTGSDWWRTRWRGPGTWISDFRTVSDGSIGCVWKCWVNIPNEITIFHRDNDQQNHWVQGFSLFSDTPNCWNTCISLCPIWHHM